MKKEIKSKLLILPLLLAILGGLLWYMSSSAPTQDDISLKSKNQIQKNIVFKNKLY